MVKHTQTIRRQQLVKIYLGIYNVLFLRDLIFEIIHKLYKIFVIYLTHLVPVLLSYRNQSTDLLCKSNDWFLHEDKTGT